MPSSTASGSQVILQGGAQAANIFWQVGSSATLGTTSIFNGTILAQASITITTGAALIGRALARTGAVTMDSNTIVNPGAPVSGPTPPTLTVTCPVNVGQLGVAYTSVLAATGGTSPYTFSITASLPSGLILNATTGAITGTPTFISTISFTARAQDSVSGTATNGCSIAITATPPGSPPGTPTVPAPTSVTLVLI